MSYKVYPVEEYKFHGAVAICDQVHDKFSKTFRAKATAMDLWPLMRGVCDDDGNLLGAIIVRVSKRVPHVANLQLLHTFWDHRRQGIARHLVESEFARVSGEAEYFRVSAEVEAVPFYRAMGFRFWGRQKSGSHLSVFRIGGPTVDQGVYDLNDPVITKAVYSNQRGGVVEIFEEWSHQ